MTKTFVRSTLGSQVNGALNSAPIYSFGTSTRDHREKLFVTEEHAKLNIKNKSPGPHADYHRRSTLARTTSDERGAHKAYGRG